MAYDDSSIDVGESTKKSFADQLLANDAVWYAAIPPLGAILAWAPGYFAAAGNGGGWTDVTITLSDSWKECDGSALSAEDSPEFGGASHYLPDLTDDRFLMGDTAVGGTGGANSITIASANLPTHTHLLVYNAYSNNALYSSNSVAKGHDYSTDESYLFRGHSSDPDVGKSSDGGFANDAFNNRPVYLACKFIMRVE